MCTALSYKTKDHYFGRNLDLDHTYNETVTITPRNYCYHFSNGSVVKEHFAMIGMATVVNDYPLYYEATNECGLSMAGLNFPGNAKYLPIDLERENLAPYELISWILCQCSTVSEAKMLLKDVNVADIPFSKEFALSPLHWLISDSVRSVVIEPRSDGLHIYENPVGVLTNNPPFDYHMQNLSNFINLTAREPANRFSDKIELDIYSRGMGAIGLPGDLSSASRFIKATFTKLNSISGDSESESISQFFHILYSVAQQRGCVCVGDGFEITVYSSCCNTVKGIYYYTTYENSQITAVKMHDVDLEAKTLFTYPLIKSQQINYQN